MKSLLPALLLVALSATSYAAVKVDSGHYLLLYPSATIETDFDGACVRLRNISEGVVYLPITSIGDWRDSIRTLEKRLKADACDAR